jgi:hypothetical protein
LIFAINQVAEIADKIPALRFLNLGHSMEQFSHTLASQTRLDVEGAHLLLLNHNFRRWKNVRFPEPLLVAEGVLVESWEDGVIISDFIARYSKWRDVAGLGGNEQGGAAGNGVCGAVLGAYIHLRQYLQELVLTPLRPVLQVLLPAGGAPVDGDGNGGERRPALSVELAHFIVSVGEDLYLKMLLVDNLMHGA